MASGGSKVWTLFSLAAALAAAAVAKKSLNTSWRAATGKNPPENPADPDVDVWEAVLWAARQRHDRRPGPDARAAPGRQLLQGPVGELPPQLQQGDEVPAT